MNAPLRIELAAETKERSKQIQTTLLERQQIVTEFRSKVEQRQKSLEMKAILEEADNFFRKPAEPFDENLYLAYSNKGERSAYDTGFHLRARQLEVSAQAFWLSQKPEYLEGTIRALEMILEEPTWFLSAHDGDCRALRGLTNDIDLGVARRGLIISSCLFVLMEHLPPELVERLSSALRGRVLKPYLRRYRASEEELTELCFWTDRANNWNAVCHAGVVCTAIFLDVDAVDKSDCIAGAERCMEIYLNGFTQDGYCSEGVGYWNYGFSHFVFLAEMIRVATGNTCDLWGLDPVKLRKIAAYPQEIQLTPGSYPGFSDNSPHIKPTRWVEDTARHRTGLPPIAPDVAALPATSLMELFSTVVPTAVITPVSSIPQNVSWFPDAQVIVLRKQLADGRPVAIAAKGGHNDELHNHNDLGTFVIDVAGAQLISDVGGEIYTRRTFSSARYESAVLNSFGHSVPLPARILQQAGSQAQASVVEVLFSEEESILELDLKQAYPCKQLVLLRRTFRFKNASDFLFQVEDKVKFSGAEHFEIGLMSLHPLKPRGDWNWVVESDGQQLELSVQIQANPAGAEWKSVLTELDTELMCQKKAFRLAVSCVVPIKEAVITCSFRVR